MIKIGVIGDMILGDHPLYYGVGVRSRMERNHLNPFEFVAPILKQCDIVISNLETVLSDRGMERKNYYSFQMRGSGHFITFLKEAGINVVNIANNHLLQHGVEAMQDTIDSLKKNNIRIVGTAKDNKKLTEVKTRKIGIMGYSFRPERFLKNTDYYEIANEKKIHKDLASAKEIADYVIITLHWGDEYVSQPASWQIELAHRLVDKGADIILGHHPHVLQPIEIYKGKLIAYSLGNFISDMCQDLAKKTLILKIKLSDNKISYNVIPIYINNEYQPVPIKDLSSSSWFPKILEKTNDEEYQQRVFKSVRNFRREYYTFLIKNFYKYSPKCLFEIFLDFLKRRICRIY